MGLAVPSLENRRHARVACQLRGWCEAENVTVYGRVGNLSESGLFLHTGTPLRAGARASVRLHAGEGGARLVQTLAKVVWTRHNGHGGPPGMGLQFEALGEAQLERLRHIIFQEQARGPGA